VALLSFCRWNGYETFEDAIKGLVAGPFSGKASSRQLLAKDLLDECGKWLEKHLSPLEPPQREVDSGHRHKASQIYSSLGDSDAIIKPGINLVLCHEGRAVYNCILSLVSSFA
jgi:hypothetical protein